MTKLSDVMWKEEVERAGRKLAAALIHQNYVPNEEGTETRDRILATMGAPFGLRWDAQKGEWVAG